MPRDNFDTNRFLDKVSAGGFSDQCKPPHVCPDLVLLQRSVPLLLQSIQLQPGCLQFPLLGQLLGHQLLLLSLGLRQRPLLLQVDLFQLCPLCCLLVQQPVMENTAMRLKMSLSCLFYPLSYYLEQGVMSSWSRNTWVRVDINSKSMYLDYGRNPTLTQGDQYYIILYNSHDYTLSAVRVFHSLLGLRDTFVKH